MHQATAPQKVAIYTNQGEGRAWRKRGIATSGSHSIVLVDLLNDSRLSIYGANWNSNTSTGRIIELWVG